MTMFKKKQKKQNASLIGKTRIGSIEEKEREIFYRAAGEKFSG